MKYIDPKNKPLPTSAGKELRIELPEMTRELLLKAIPDTRICQGSRFWFVAEKQPGAQEQAIVDRQWRPWVCEHQIDIPRELERR